MKDIPRMLEKLDFVGYAIRDLRKHLEGKREKWEDPKVHEYPSIMSEAMDLIRKSTELLQQITTSWRKELKTKEDKLGGR